MTLQTAITAKTASDAANIQPVDILDSPIMDVIDLAVTAASTRTDLDKRTYKIVLSLAANVNGETGPVKIIQSDDTQVLLSDIENSLVNSGYRISYRVIKDSRVGVDDRVKLQIAWD